MLFLVVVVARRSCRGPSSFLSDSGPRGFVGAKAAAAAARSSIPDATEEFGVPPWPCRSKPDRNLRSLSRAGGVRGGPFVDEGEGRIRGVRDPLGSSEDERR